MKTCIEQFATKTALAHSACVLASLLAFLAMILPLAADADSVQGSSANITQQTAQSTSASENEKSSSFNLPANMRWYNTGINLTSGRPVTITARGRVTVGAWFSGNNIETPAGKPALAHTYQFGGALAAQGLPPWSLVGRIGFGKPFEVGTRLTLTPTVSGRLYLCVNDNNFADNRGSWNVTIGGGISEPSETTIAVQNVKVSKTTVALKQMFQASVTVKNLLGTKTRFDIRLVNDPILNGWRIETPARLHQEFAAGQAKTFTFNILATSIATRSFLAQARVSGHRLWDGSSKLSPDVNAVLVPNAFAKFLASKDGKQPPDFSALGDIHLARSVWINAVGVATAIVHPSEIKHLSAPERFLWKHMVAPVDTPVFKVMTGPNPSLTHIMGAFGWYGGFTEAPREGKKALMGKSSFPSNVDSADTGTIVEAIAKLGGEIRALHAGYRRGYLVGEGVGIIAYQESKK